MVDKISKDGVKPGSAVKGKPSVKTAVAAKPQAATAAKAAVTKPKPAAAPASSSVEAVAPAPKITTPAPVAPVVEPIAEVAAPVVEEKVEVAAVPAAEEIPVTPEVVKPALKVAKSAEKPAIPAAPLATTEGAASKTASVIEQTFAGLFNPFRLEDTTMAVTDFSGFQDAITEAQAKAKAAFEKGTSALGEVTEFSKGNVEAVIESGKIFAEGVQGLGSEFVTEGRSAFETITADIKELAAVKSPTDFFKIQGDLLRKNFDSAVAYSSKNSEAVLKLVSDSFAPISGRVSIALEKARSTSF